MRPDARFRGMATDIPPSGASDAEENSFSAMVHRLIGVVRSPTAGEEEKAQARQSLQELLASHKAEMFLSESTVAALIGQLTEEDERVKASPAPQKPGGTD